MKRKHNTIIFLIFLMLQCGIVQSQQTLTLEQIKSKALENNKRLKRAQSSVNAAKAASAAANAADKPTVDASVFGMYLSDPFKTLLPEYSANGSVAVTQVVYAGSKIQTAKKMTGAAVELQNAQKELTEDEVLLSAESTYWQIINLKEKQTLAENYLKLLKELK